jgi:hypothetical protein
MSDNAKRFKDMWNNLSEKERIKRIKKAFKIIVKKSEEQLKFIEDKKKNNPPEEVGFLYFENTIANIWENVDFIFSIKKKYRNLSFYPTRCVMESTFRLDHFVRQNSKTKEDITIKEFLRVLKRTWDMENNKGNQRGMSEVKQNYNQFVSLGEGYPNIENVSIKALDPFPNIKDILIASKVHDISLYYHYCFLSELSHGKLMHIITKNINLVSEYRRSLMSLLMMCYKVLEVFDFYLFKKVEKNTRDIIKKAQKIITHPFPPVGLENKVKL